MGKKNPEMTGKIDIDKLVEKMSKLQGQHRRKPTKKWEKITQRVWKWVGTMDNPEWIKQSDPNSYAMSYDWGWVRVNLARITFLNYTKLAVVSPIEGVDLEFYNSIGAHDWKVLARLTAYQIDRGEIEFSEDPPDVQLHGRLYDDSFSEDLLYHRCRELQSGISYVIGIMKMLRKSNRYQRVEEYMEKLDALLKNTRSAPIETVGKYEPGPHYI